MDNIAKFIWFILLLIFGYLIITTIDENSKINSDENSSVSETQIIKIETFDDAKSIIPGKWISEEVISDNYKQYNLLLFNQDGTLKFAQGSSIEQSFKLANESTLKGNWSILDNPKYLPNLQNDKRFLIEFKIEGIGSELFRVEIDAAEYQMGRTKDENDEARESMSLFTFGGKIFYKK
jgi:hypothetical protein